MKNVIGGKHVLSDELWALSLVRRQGKDHSFLVLEGIQDGKPFIREIHLVIKENSQNRKADIIDRDISVQKLQDLGNNCHSYTWSVTQNQVKALLALVEHEKERCSNDQINYVMLGETTTGGFLGNSYQASGLGSAAAASVASTHQLVANATASSSGVSKTPVQRLKEQIVGFLGQSAEASVDALLVEGHNCHSWAVSMVQSLRLPKPTSWLTFIVVAPKHELQGTHDGDDTDPTSEGCRLM